MPHTTLFLACSYKQHVKDNRKVFSFKLDEQDKAAIAAVQQKGKSLSGAFGNFLYFLFCIYIMNCGDIL